MLQRLLLIFLAQSVISRVMSVLTTWGLPLPVRMALMALGAILALVISMWIWQESILYVPGVPNPENPLMGGSLRRPADGPSGMRSPAERNLPYEDVNLVCSDGVKCHAWFLPAANRAHAPTLLFSHENAGSMALRLPQLEILHGRLRCNILAYDYRGYGDSDDAAINEEGLMRDAHAAWRWLVQQGGIDPKRIVLYGASLGGAVSIQLAKDLCESGDAPLPMGLVLCNTFTSIEAMLGAKYKWLDFPFVRKYMLRLQWRSIEHITKVKQPICIIVGSKDEIVPADHAQQLQRAAIVSPAVSCHAVPSGSHNDTWIKAGPLYVSWLQEFFEAVDGTSKLAESKKAQ